LVKTDGHPVGAQWHLAARLERQPGSLL
jgi:hypothetical protein